MRRLPGLLALILFATACSGLAIRPTPTTPSTTSPTSTAPVDAATSTTGVEPTTSTTVSSGPPVAWIAPSGVPVAVTSVIGERIEVLTPCGNEEILTEGTPVYEVDVVIDPGHGGPIDTGAVGANGLSEKEINLRVSRAIHEILTNRGVASFLTRTGDYPIPIRTRSAYSDLVGARALVSIHHNAPQAPVSEIPGVEIFVQNTGLDSARLGGLIYDRSMDALSEFDVAWQRSPDAGVMTVLNSDGRDAYGMVRLPDAPSALVELGYMANPAEAELYTDPAYVTNVSIAVADAIEAFLVSEETGSPLVEGRNFNPARGVGFDQCIEPDLHHSLYPDVVEASVTGGDGSYNFVVTMSSPYDTPDRYADAWRVVGDDGEVYGVLELAHDHAGEQPFTRSLAGVEIPLTVERVRIEGRDLVYGWGGATFELSLP
jgi:N-acetylmuramoyl-L-alanine amidase